MQLFRRSTLLFLIVAGCSVGCEEEEDPRDAGARGAVDAPFADGGPAADGGAPVGDAGALLDAPAPVRDAALAFPDVPAEAASERFLRARERAVRAGCACDPSPFSSGASCLSESLATAEERACILREYGEPAALAYLGCEALGLEELADCLESSRIDACGACRAAYATRVPCPSVGGPSCFP